jgi:dihydroflavonol-4-reductase
VDGGINLIDVNDVAAGHIAAMERGKPGSRYVLGNTNLSMKQYFDLIAEVAGTFAPALQFPLPLAIAAAYGYEAMAKITSKPPLTTVSWVKVGSHYSFWDSSKAIRELGLPQSPIRESLRQAITWFRERNYL